MKKEIDTFRKKRKKINENIIYKLTSFIFKIIKTNNIKHTVIGLYYLYFHLLIIILVGFNLVFSVNLNHLIVLLIIVSLDALSVVVLHGCPLTILEEKYLKINSCEERTKGIKSLGIFYRCDHEYEKQIELLVNVWTLIAGKCLLLIFFRTFKIKLKNYYNIFE